MSMGDPSTAKQIGLVLGTCRPNWWNPQRGPWTFHLTPIAIASVSGEGGFDSKHHVRRRL
jgi:hypothetical protein